jgi:capsular polysaccharide biosynthesis protein
MPRLPAPLRPLFPYLQPTYVRMNRLAAPLTVGLSRMNGGYVPTGIVQTLEEAASTSGGRCVTARPPETIVRPPLVGFPEGLASLEPAGDTRIPRLAVAELPGGRVLGPSRALITGNNDLVWELSHYFGTRNPKEHPVFGHPFPGEPAPVEGRLGVLASRGDRNYYHFLIDVLPRIGVLELAPDIAPPTRWYVPAATPVQREFLELMGITAAHRIDSDEVPHVRAECLVVPGLPSVVKEKNPPWVVEFLRGRLMRGTEPPPLSHRHPVYVARTAGAHNRAVRNQPEVLRRLERRGFEVIDPANLTAAQQIESFRSASVIVCAHGAALANLVFASPGSAVVELFPAGGALPDYWRLASSAGLTYRYLSSWSRSGRPSSRSKLIVSDIEVDIPALEHLLDQLGDEAGLAA